MATSMEPERTLATESIFEGKIIRVRVDTVALPGGRRVTREVVEHRPVAVIVPIDSEDRVLLVRQFRYAIGRRCWRRPRALLRNRNRRMNARSVSSRRREVTYRGICERLAASGRAPGSLPSSSTPIWRKTSSLAS